MLLPALHSIDGAYLVGSVSGTMMSGTWQWMATYLVTDPTKNLRTRADQGQPLASVNCHFTTTQQLATRLSLCSTFPRRSMRVATCKLQGEEAVAA